ncbi:MAG: hypothetical protein LC685_02325, partial [Actinobacteria bacterium]|nr:hypothetical protein [Actinomycetota bacterium]
ISSGVRFSVTQTSRPIRGSSDGYRLRSTRLRTILNVQANREGNMTSINDVVRAGQEQFLDNVRQSQQAVVDAVGAWAKTVDGTSSQANGSADSLPNAGELVENAFDFAEQLLAAQREFMRNLLAATSPAVQRVAKNAETAAKEAKKAAANA